MTPRTATHSREARPRETVREAVERYERFHSGPTVHSLRVSGSIQGLEGTQRRFSSMVAAEWRVATGSGTSHDVNAGGDGAPIPDCELVLEMERGRDDIEGWDPGDRVPHGPEHLSRALLLTRDPRLIRAYAEVLRQLADLVEADQ